MFLIDILVWFNSHRDHISYVSWAWSSNVREQSYINRLFRCIRHFYNDWIDLSSYECLILSFLEPICWVNQSFLLIAVRAFSIPWSVFNWPIVWLPISDINSKLGFCHISFLRSYVSCSSEGRACSCEVDFFLSVCDFIVFILDWYSESISDFW